MTSEKTKSGLAVYRVGSGSPLVVISGASPAFRAAFTGNFSPRSLLDTLVISGIFGEAGIPHPRRDVEFRSRRARFAVGR